MDIPSFSKLAEMHDPTSEHRGCIKFHIQPTDPTLNPNAPTYDELFRSSSSVASCLECMKENHGVAYSAFAWIPNGVIKIHQVNGVYYVQYTVIGTGVVGPFVITQPPGGPLIH
jgi:hypothetical protein